MKYIILPALIITGLSTGCASITTGQTQPISIETRDNQGQQVSGAACKLVNDKGTYFVTSPGTVGVQRSYNDLSVNCSREKSEPGMITAKSSTKAMAFGNILFGGVIGAAVDAGTGAAYDYPALLTVIMGQVTALPPPPVAAAESVKAATN